MGVAVWVRPKTPKTHQRRSYASVCYARGAAPRWLSAAVWS